MSKTLKKKKFDLYTKEEAKAVAKEVMAFFKKLEKRDGKKFEQSFSATGAIISRGDDGEPKGGGYFARGNVFVMKRAVFGGARSIAQNQKTSVTQVLAEIACDSIFGE